MKRQTAVLFAVSFLWISLASANDQPDSQMNWRIRREVTENSHLMRLVHQLTDVYGPRLTGSPNFKAACEWAVRQLKLWGLEDAHTEAWDFGHYGWSNESYSVRVTSPYMALLDAGVVAWTQGTKGIVSARVVQITPPENPTAEALDAYLESVKDRVRDRIVLAGAHKEVPVAFNPPIRRKDDAELRSQYDPDNPPPKRPPETPAHTPRLLGEREADEKIDAFLVANGARVRIFDSAREHGQIRVLANRTYNAAKAVAGIVIRNEDYGRLSRVLADGNEIEMEIEILNTIHPDQTSMNVVAEIPGGDRKDEVVMLGAHIDSWHAGLGATDNATGVAVMMEAVRVLQTLGVKPRRTIRIALWGGEEQGLLGSKAYVREHFGSFESPKQEFPALSAYVNLDSGTGRVRGASVFGPSQSAAVLRQALLPFADLGVVGVNSTQNRGYGGTDTASFNQAGLPTVNLYQDPIEYSSHTWHTNLDTYERVVDGDLKQCAIVTASIVYRFAMREELLPRFPADSMPPPEK